MTVTVKTFALVRDICGFEDKKYSLSPQSTVHDLLTILLKEYPSLSGIQTTLLFAVNDEYSSLDTVLGEGDICAVFPPVSGG